MDCPHLGASSIEIGERIKKAQVGFGIEEKLMLVLAGNRDQKGRNLLELLHRGGLVVYKHAVSPAFGDAPPDYEFRTELDPPLAEILFTKAPGRF
jgi:hypothetical protein